MNAVIDEDLPRSFAAVLTQSGFTAIDIRDHNLRGAPDERIFQFAQQKHAILFSADLGFANTFDFPLGSHAGICILRFPNELPVQTTNREIQRLLNKIPKADFPGNLVILSPGKIRIRRFQQSS